MSSIMAAVHPVLRYFTHNLHVGNFLLDQIADIPDGLDHSTAIA